MTATTLQLESMECHIEDLQKQQAILQNIERYTDKRLDFGDFIETHNLLGEEIARLQQELRQEGQVGPGEEVFEEEEEEEDSPLSFHHKYRLEHVIEDKGILRPLKAEDLYVENNSHVREAFKVLYEMKKSYDNGGGVR